ncbi:abortive infection family protein [Xanthobacter aminoxidans]|uniref:abortive infection family protein n=1 Tax=Xanthobacter aminoxidans TaxID=186280 RepID=UPI00372D3319
MRSTWRKRRRAALDGRLLTFPFRKAGPAPSPGAIGFGARLKRGASAKRGPLPKAGLNVRHGAVSCHSALRSPITIADFAPRLFQFWTQQRWSTINQITDEALRSLGVTVAGLGEMRNFYGSGHGQDGRARDLTSRHAGLAVDAASTLVMFL